MVNQTINGGTFYGQVTAVNNGEINQKLEIISKGNEDLSDLLRLLVQDNSTQFHAQKVVDDIANLEQTSPSEKKGIVDRLVENTTKLVIVAEASTHLYPIAEKVFEFVKGLI